MAKRMIYEINRKKFKELNRMDHNQTKEYLGEIYQEGMAAGMKMAGDSFDMEICMTAVSQIKGIGPAKLKEIRLAIIAAGAKEKPLNMPEAGKDAGSYADNPTMRGLDYGA